MNKSAASYLFKPVLLDSIKMGKREDIRYEFHCGEIFIVVSPRTVYCYSIHKAELKWSCTRKQKNDTAICGSEHVVVIEENANKGQHIITALSLKDGSICWSAKDNYCTEPYFIFEHLLITVYYERSTFSVVCAYHLHTGERLWVNDSIYEVRRVQTHRGNLLFLSDEDENIRLNIVNAITGEVISRELIVGVGLDTYSEIVIDDRLLLAGENSIVAYDLIARVVLWTFKKDKLRKLNFIGESDGSFLVAYRYTSAYKKVIRISFTDGSIIEQFDIENTYDCRDDFFYIAYRGNRLYSGDEKQLLCYDLALHRTICRHVDNKKAAFFACPSYFHGNTLLTVNNFDNILNWYEIPELVINAQTEQEAQLRAQFSNEEWQYLRQTPLAMMAPLADLVWGSREEMMVAIRSHLQAVAEQGNLLVSCTLGDLIRELPILLSHWAELPPDLDHLLTCTYPLLIIQEDQALATGYKQAIYQLAENFACSPRGEAPLALSEIPPLKQQMLASYRQILLG